MSVGVHDWMLAWVSLVHAGDFLPKELDAYLREHVGISLPEQDLLKQLDSNDGVLSMGELARRLFFSKAGMTKMIARLEALDAVQRRPSDQDRRVILVELLEQGRQRLSQSRELLVPWVERNLRAHLSDDQLLALKDALGDLLKGHGRYEAQMRHLKGEPG